MPKRKQLRLIEYDYSQNGAYFVTVSTKNRQYYFGEVTVGCDAHIAPYVHLSPYGEIVKKYIENINRCYQNISLDNYVIMPNHIHLLLIIDGGPMKASAPTESIINVIRSLKILATKTCGITLWQRSYHEHVIRNEQDYQQIWKYINENPLKWELDRYYQGKLE